MPEFRTEDEERDFWAEHDVVDYFDWEKSVSGSFPALKPSTETISLRLPKALLEELKTLANEWDFPYHRAGQHSIRINQQWRICLRWRSGDAYDVEIVDY